MWLRYRNGGGAWTNARFVPTFLREIPSSLRVSDVTLRGRIFDKRLHGRTSYAVTISADELGGASNANLTFLKAFWKADEREYNASTSGTLPVADWIAVQVDGGDLPLDYVEDMTLLPEVSFRMNKKEPD